MIIKLILDVKVNLKNLLIVLIFMIVLTIIFDNLLIKLNFFYYNPKLILGLKIYLMPIEDLAYTVGGLFLIVYLWEKNK